MKKLSVVGLVILVAAGCGQQGIVTPEVVNQAQTEQDQNENVNTVTEIVSADDVDTSDWLTYANVEYGFSFRYPKEWTVKQLDKQTIGLVSSELQAELDKGPTSINNSDLILKIYTPSTSAPFMLDSDFNVALEKAQQKQNISDLTFMGDSRARFIEYNDFATTNQYGQYILVNSNTVITSIYGMNLDTTPTLEKILSSVQ